MKCKNCKYFRQPVNTNRGKCTRPDRNDGKLVYYFGSLKETDYCALFEKYSINTHGVGRTIIDTEVHHD